MSESSTATPPAPRAKRGTTVKHRGKLSATVLVVAVAVTALAGCAPGGEEREYASRDDRPRSEREREPESSPTPTPTPTPDQGGTAFDQPVTVTVAYWGNFFSDDMVMDFEDQYPNIYIELMPGEHGATHENLQQQLIAGSGAPTVVAIDEDYHSGFLAQSDNFVNLLDLGAGQFRDSYPAWKWAQSSTADQSAVIALGHDVGGMGLCYRADLFEDAGLAYERDAVAAAMGDSWDGFVDFGESYVAASGDAFVDNASSFLDPVIDQQGGSHTFFDQAGTLDMDNVRPAANVALDIIDADLSANIAPWSIEWTSGFSNGEFAALPCPSWMLGYIAGTISDDFAGQWDVTDLPGPGGNWGGAALAIPAQFDDYTTQAAYEFIEFVTQPESQLDSFYEFGTIPARLDALSHPDVQDYLHPFFNYAPVGTIASDAVLEIPGAQSHGPFHNAARVAVESVLNDVQSGTVASDDAWSIMVSDVEAIN